MTDTTKHDGAVLSSPEFFRQCGDNITSLLGKIETQSAEIERLRASLEEIKKHWNGEAAGRIAEQALKGGA